MDPFESSEVSAQPESGARKPGRSKRLVIAGAAAVALAIGMLAGGALSSGAAVAQTTTETPTPDAPTGTDSEKDGRDCPNKDKGGSGATQTSVSV